MTRLSLGLAWLCLSLACNQENRAQPKPTQPALMLDESFSVGAAKCRVTGTTEHVTEPKAEADSRRVQPDVHAIAVALSCEDAAGRPLSPEQAIPKDWVILLFSSRGERIAPSTRTYLSDELPGQLIFEITSDDPIVARLRRYDAESGRRTTLKDTAFGKLQLSAEGALREIELRPRALTPKLEDALDRLMEELTSRLAGAPQQESARMLHRDVLDRAEVRTFSLVPRFEGPSSGRLLLGYAEKGTISSGLDELALRFTYDLGMARIQVTGIENELPIKRALGCERDKARLKADAHDAYVRLESEVDCHVLGLLLPGPCNDTDPALLSRALDVLARCIEPGTLRTSGSSLPEDFQLTLRRGRGGSALDRSPRYLVSLFAAGEVVLHGKHWVNHLGRSDGRTSPRVLSALYAHMQKLEWFDRRGGEWSADACATDDEQGQVVTLHGAGRERMILDRDGCRGPFSARELDEIRALVEAAIGIESYTRARPEYADTKARIWTVE